MNIEMNFDVVVCGGGPAGVPAAVQAARAGARTLLIEKSSRLGGVTVNAGINRPALFHAWGRQVIAGIGWELVCRTIDQGGGFHPDYENLEIKPFAHAPEVDVFFFSTVCDEAVVSSGAHLMLHAHPVAIRPAGDGWIMTLAVKEGLLDLKTRIVIDATGDANLIALAGGPVRVHPQTQPATLNFELDGYDPSNVNFDRLDAAFREAIKRGEVQPADGSWNVETPSLRRLVGWRGRNGNHVSATADARTSRGRTQIEVEGRAAVARLLRFLNRQPGFENLRLRSVSPEAGIRETVTIKGDIEVTVDDYLSGRHWPDSICHGYYPLDLHGLTAKEGVCRMLDEGIVPTIPLGALIPHGMEGALVAGRCLSSDRLANSALRVQAICMAMGQATGAAAALAVQKQCPIRKIPLEDLRTLLTAHGAIVPE